MSYEQYGERFIEQLELEDNFKNIAEEFLKRDIDKKKTDGNASHSSLGKRLMNHSFEDIKAAIQLFVDKSLLPKAGVKPEYVAILENLYSIYSDDMEKLYNTLTYIPFSVLLDSVFQREFRLSNLCQLIAVDIQNEVKIEKYCKDYPEQIKSLNKGINERVAKHFKLYYTLKRMEYTGYVWNAWNTKTASHLAAKLIEIILSVTNWFEFVTPTTQGKNATLEVQPTQYLLETWYKNEEWLLNHAFKLCPTIIPPDDWVDFRNGGYYGKLKGTSTFLRLGYGGERDAIKSTYVNRLNQLELTKVKQAVNSIQATPWKVNSFILSIVKEIIKGGGEIGGIPRMEPLPELARLSPIHTPEELEELKRKAIKRIKAENSRKGKAIRCIAHLKIAEKFAKYDRIYFPHNMDFRGRIYPIPSFSPQGDDLNKALLLLADTKPITDATYIDWFFIQGANLAGIDKVPYTERIAWINANESKILESAEDPLQNRFWSNQDSPFQFLAFCVEYKRYKKHLDEFGTPLGFKTGLVISFDGSCSGLQHFSAILRDPIGGKAVNLTPSDTVQDIYQVVADIVKLKVKEDAQAGTLDDYYIDKETGTQTDKIKYGTRTLAQQWLTYGITRKVTKRPVMTLAYGAKEYGFAEQIMEDTIEPALLNGTGLMFVAPRQASGYLAKHIWDAVGQTVTKAVEGMAWLQEMAKLVTKSGHVVTWYTPLGLPVQQSYVKCDTDILQLRLCGSLKRVYSFKSTGEIDKKKQASAIAPNFIHSMDATHLMQTVLNSSKQGVTHFAMVHDSYGTTLADAQVLYDTVRSTFCDMYNNNDVLANFRKDMEIYIKNPSKIPQLPTKGGLDLNTVKKSLYAFS